MKLLVALFTLVSAVALHAAPPARPTSDTDINSTVAELSAKYGKPVKTEKGWYGQGQSYGFQPSKQEYIWATSNPAQTRIEDLIYVRFDKNWKMIPSTDADLKKVLLANCSQHITWTYDRYPYWGDNIVTVTHLNQEAGLHHIEYEFASTKGVIVNKPLKPEIVGVQVRTIAQYEAEQPAVKSFLKKK